MSHDIFQSVPQRSIGAQDAENSRIEAISNELRRRCQLYEAERGESQPHVNQPHRGSAPPAQRGSSQCPHRESVSPVNACIEHREVRVLVPFLYPELINDCV